MLLFNCLFTLLPCCFYAPTIRKLFTSENFRAAGYQNRYRLITLLILTIGFAVRIWNISEIPMGLNQDEASAGYDAWSILNYGIDRNGFFLPVHLFAWGSGQNALYSYLCIPFIAVFGLSAFSIRLPMALIGCGSLIVMKKLLDGFEDERLTAIGTALLAVAPWHIMKSRWALESNLLPDMILLALLLICLGLKGKRIYFYAGCAVMGLSAYAYGTSYFFLPLFFILFFGLLIKTKKLTIKRAVCGIALAFIIALPIVLFVIINTFDLPSITTPFFSIPKLNEARQAAILKGDLLGNFLSCFSMLLKQNDGMPWNSMNSFFGTIYIFSAPFVLVGIITALRRKEKSAVTYAFLCWLAVSVAMMFVMSSNINRMNLIFIPLIYFTALGIYALTKKRIVKATIGILYTVSFAAFVFSYAGAYQQDIARSFSYGFGDAVDFSETLDKNVCRVTPDSGSTYMLLLFYTETPPNEYLKTRVVENPDSAFENIVSFGKYQITDSLPSDLDESTCAIIPAKDAEAFQAAQSGIKSTVFGNYAVVWQ